ncbi:hypothetical protein ASPCADRAFT_210805 [Aspergillus carbonarius ITEM 5010]|uniref:Uncharacterized protein n=1 Tax=Aspergillus carbonarius (strain ITEM 5010) TaxID=602072 RepID=A0A1R3RBQ1_ASPC5|nr:hypothetical protein ASPCADRAFT_210805 [Aspergillus carbonarius ITEM 5010]
MTLMTDTLVIYGQAGYTRRTRELEPVERHRAVSIFGGSSSSSIHIALAASWVGFLTCSTVRSDHVP